MKIQYCSDLHLEFAQNNQLMRNQPLIPSGEILILAGDIVPFRVHDKYSNFFDYVSENFEKVYWLPGNHEYYGYDISLKEPVLNEKIRDNVFLVNNITINHKNIRLVFSTLWSKINPVNEYEIQQSLSDFHVIKNKGSKLTPYDYNELHNTSLDFLSEALKPSEIPTIVATHHLPTFMNYPQKYRDSPLNEAFATELHNLIDSSNAQYWIYGHSHSNTPEFTIGKTKLITNQLGYVQHAEHKTFMRDATFFL